MGLAVVVALVPACNEAIPGSPEAAEPSQSTQADATWIESVLPDSTELSQVFNSDAEDIDPLVGDASDLRETMIGSDVTERQCIGTVSPLERQTYAAAPVHEVAYATLSDATFGALVFSSAADARSFFDTSVTQWLDCDGRTVTVTSGAGSHTNKISDVEATADVISAAVMMSTQSTGMQSPTGRALGVAENCIVDVELSTSVTASAVALTRLMLAKVLVQQ